MTEPDYDKDMKLPDGKTCSDCFASRFCIGIGCTTPERTTCDYWPNRFRLRAAPPSTASGPAGTPTNKETK